MPDFPSDVAVAIVSHNNLGPLPKTLESLAAAGCPQSQIAVVDVASTDGTGDWLRANWPGITQHRLEKNDGPSPGRNVGILRAEKPFVFLMDADVFIRPDTVQLLKAEMDRDANIKIGSPIVVHASRPDVIQYAGGALHYICEAVNPWMDRPLAERGSEPMDIGAAPTVRAAARSGRGHRHRAVRRALLHRQGRRRLHAPLQARRLHDARAARVARAPPQPPAPARGCSSTRSATAGTSC